MIKICKECENEFKTYDNKRKYCSISCSAKHLSRIHKGKGNPMYGKHVIVSEKNKQKRSKFMKEYWKNPDNKDEIKNRRKKMSENRNGKTYEEIFGEEKAKLIKEKRSRKFTKNNPMHDPLIVKKISIIRTGSECSEETKQKLSQYFSQPHISMQYSKRMIGRKNPAWAGGCSNEYGPGFGRRLKREIRDRDNHICQFCLVEENGKRLDVHHIDYDKFNNDPTNLIACCHSCHSNTLFDRDMWIEICQDIVLAKYKTQKS